MDKFRNSDKVKFCFFSELRYNSQHEHVYKSKNKKIYVERLIEHILLLYIYIHNYCNIIWNLQYKNTILLITIHK